MKALIQSNIPKCPFCSSGMFKQYQDNLAYFVCPDCLTVYKIISKGQIDNEVLISDNINDREEEDERLVAE